MSAPPPDWLARGPVTLPDNWTEIVKVAQTDKELEDFRHRVNVGKPFGSQEWPPTSSKQRGRPNLRNTKKEGLTPGLI